MVGAMKGMRIIGRAGALALLVAATGASAQEGEAVKSILGASASFPRKRRPSPIMSVLRSCCRPRWTCRAPAAGGGAEARNGNWPKDPDVAARRKAAAEARTPYTSSELYKNSEGQRLSIEEMRAGRNPNNIVTTAPTNGRPSGRSQPHDARRAARLLQGREAELQGNGLERRYLSDPPGDLLKAQGGRRLKASADPAPMGDPDSPSAYLRQQQSRQ